MAKKIVCIASLAIVSISLMLQIGCTNCKLHIIDNKNVVTNNVPMRAFNDETYVWESWQFGTNKVENAIK